MLERAEIVFEGRMADTLKVVLPNGAILAAVNLVQIDHLLTCASLLLSIAYTLWRWKKGAPRDKD